MIDYFIGIDVQSARGCACAVLDRDGGSFATNWEPQARALVEWVQSILARNGANLAGGAVGIDGPRLPLRTPREHYWDGTHQQWRPRRAGERGYGRHCEIAVSALGLATPQWTPLIDRVPPWMSLGFQLFQEFSQAQAGAIHEVFPSASYTLFAEEGTRLEIDLTTFEPGPKDMLDAYVCAATVREFTLGRGCEVGNGDGLGTIVLPRPVNEPDAPVLVWPPRPLGTA